MLSACVWRCVDVLSACVCVEVCGGVECMCVCVEVCGSVWKCVEVLSAVHSEAVYTACMMQLPLFVVYMLANRAYGIMKVWNAI